MDNEPSITDQLSDFYFMHSSEHEAASSDQQHFYTELKPESTRYIYEEELSKGGMKTIYDAFDPKTGRHVALAKLHPDSPEKLFEPFLREARLTAQLDHPNCISIYDIGLDEHSVPYFTMELKTGKSLADLISDQSDRSLLEHFIKICDAIAYAHSLEILHLDLKPENIQVGLFGEVVVCDWGLGKIIGEDSDDSYDSDHLLQNRDLLNNMTLPGEIKGTPGFMAPEQIERKCKKTTATDIYALGAILYTILAGDHPFGSDTDVNSILKKTVEGEISPPVISNLNFIFPLSLSAICMKALSPVPQDRYHSVEALREDLHNYLNGYVTSAENADFVRETRLFIARNRTICSLTALFISVIIIGIIGFIINLNQSRITAEIERKKSDSMRNRMEQTLRMYEGEKEKTTRYSDELRRNAHRIGYQFFFDDPGKALYLAHKRIDRGMELDPANKKLASVKGEHYFLVQKFSEANEQFEQSELIHQNLYELSLKYVDILADHDRLLPVDEFSKLILELGNIRHELCQLCERMVTYDHLKRRSHAGYATVIESLVRVWNAQTEGELSFDYNEQLKSLSINGKGLSLLKANLSKSSGKCLVRFLDIESLDISNTSFYDLNEISDLPHLKSLDISNTLISNLAPLKKLPVLKKLIISKGQFPKHKLAALPEGILLLEK